MSSIAVARVSPQPSGSTLPDELLDDEEEDVVPDDEDDEEDDVVPEEEDDELDVPPVPPPPPGPVSPPQPTLAAAALTPAKNNPKKSFDLMLPPSRPFAGDACPLRRPALVHQRGGADKRARPGLLALGAAPFLAPPARPVELRRVRALKLLDRASSALAARLEAELAALLSRGAPPAEAARLAGRRMDEAIEAARARALLLAPACAAGCSWCCHVHVDATLPEIDAVIAHLEATRSPEERSVIAAAAERAAALDDGARWEARIPCALLDEGGRCSVYEARPLRCRAFHSCAVEACREAFEGRAEADALPLESQVVRRAADAALRGYERALIQRGIDAEPRRLEEALAEITAR